MSVLRTALCAAAGRVEESPPGEWRATFRFATDSAVFTGHFPGRPVLPAVVQILMAQMLLERQMPSFRFSRVPQAKFFAPLGPDMDIELHIAPGRHAGIWKCECLCGDVLAARFLLEGKLP